MITTNLAMQVIFVLAQYKKKSLAVKLREVLICLFFLRPAVDAYRVSTNHEDADATVDSLVEMITNKAIETATENIPGCVRRRASEPFEHPQGQPQRIFESHALR